MRKILTVIAAVLYSTLGMAQFSSTIEYKFDLITERWLEQSNAMKKYESINSYCISEDFRHSVNGLVNEVHHYDSLILNKINDPLASLSMDYVEQGKAYADIVKLESAYSTKAFIQHMNQTCITRNEIEKSKGRLKGGTGSKSYNTKVLKLENETRIYMEQIDDLVYKVGDHLHFLYLVE